MSEDLAEDRLAVIRFLEDKIKQWEVDDKILRDRISGLAVGIRSRQDEHMRNLTAIETQKGKIRQLEHENKCLGEKIVQLGKVLDNRVGKLKMENMTLEIANKQYKKDMEEAWICFKDVQNIPQNIIVLEDKIRQLEAEKNELGKEKVVLESVNKLIEIDVRQLLSKIKGGMV